MSLGAAHMRGSLLPGRWGKTTSCSSAFLRVTSFFAENTTLGISKPCSVAVSLKGPGERPEVAANLVPSVQRRTPSM